MLETAGWFLLLQDGPEIILGTLMSQKEAVREESCTDPLENFSCFFASFVFWQRRQDDGNESVRHPMNWLAHPTCQTPLGNMKTHQKKVDVKRTGDLEGREDLKLFAWVTAEYKSNIHDLYRISIVKCSTCIQRRCRAAKKGLLAESVP